MARDGVNSVSAWRQDKGSARWALRSRQSRGRSAESTLHHQNAASLWIYKRQGCVELPHFQFGLASPMISCILPVNSDCNGNNSAVWHVKWLLTCICYSKKKKRNRNSFGIKQLHFVFKSVLNSFNGHQIAGDKEDDKKRPQFYFELAASTRTIALLLHPWQYGTLSLQADNLEEQSCYTRHAGLMLQAHYSQYNNHQCTCQSEQMAPKALAIRKHRKTSR